MRSDLNDNNYMMIKLGSSGLISNASKLFEVGAFVIEQHVALGGAFKEDSVKDWSGEIT